MPARQLSWEIRTTDPVRVATATRDAVRRVDGARGALLFVAGDLAQRTEDIAWALADSALGIPVVIAAGSAVLSERGELQDISAATGITWAGGRAEAWPLAGDEPEEVMEALARVLADQTSRSNPTAVVFLPGEGLDAEAFSQLAGLRSTHSLLGAGTLGDPGSATVAPDGRVTLGPTMMLLRGLSRPSIGVTHGCRVLGEPRPITACHGAMVTEIDGQPALELLATVGRDVAGKPLLFAVLAEPTGAGEPDSPRQSLLLRPVQGVDPGRGGVYVSSEVRPGLLMGFAIREGAAARRDMEAMTREVARELAGGAPRFGLYLDCSGRGMDLYGTTDNDTRMIIERFEKMPFAGMQSTFEIAPHHGGPALQLYSGVLGVFASLS